MPSNTPTMQYRSSLKRVLLVHENPRPCFALGDALRARYVVRTAHTLEEIREQIGDVERLACVVAIAGPRLKAREVRDEAIRIGVVAERVVIIGLEELDAIEQVLDGVALAIDALETRGRIAS